MDEEKGFVNRYKIADWEYDLINDSTFDIYCIYDEENIGDKMGKG